MLCTTWQHQNIFKQQCMLYRCRCSTTDQPSLVARLKALLEAAAHPPISPKRWQELTNDIIGAENSRKTPMYAYRCAHSSSGQEASDFCGHKSNCIWKEKRTTLLAYIKHLQDRRGEDMRKKPDDRLLPIKSFKQPSEKSRIKKDNEKNLRVTKEIKRNRLLKN